MNKGKLIVLAGPTAIGKTDLSLYLAQKYHSAIISCDSRQFYKELDIGVAAPNKEDTKIIPHYFIKNKSIKSHYSVGQYEKDGLKLLNQLFEKHNILFLCGGSGLYIDALCEGLHKFPLVPTKIKQQLNNEYIEKGLKHIQNELKKNDLNTYNTIDIKNYRRVLRALEIYRTTNVPFSEFKTNKLTKRFFNTLYISLIQDREAIYQQINNRVDEMIKNGLISEVTRLFKYRNLKPLQTIGYKELFKYIDGDITLNKAIEEIKKNTRRYAKRQITWFKNKKYIQCNIEDRKSIITVINNYLK